MTTPSRASRRGAATIEAGAVETGQHEDAPEADAPVSIAPVETPLMPRGAELTGPELNEVRIRNDATDRAGKDAQAAQAAAVQAARVAQYSQEALSRLIDDLIRWKGLDPTRQYRVDIERARIVDMGPMQAMQAPQPGG